MRVSLVCLRNSTKNLKAENVIWILHSSFYILHFFMNVLQEHLRLVIDNEFFREL